MRSLIPIASKMEPYQCYTNLIEPDLFKRKYNYEREFTVAKTSLHVEPEDEWSIVIVCSLASYTLLSSDDLQVTEATNIDLIEKIGHNITIAPWQSLRFYADFDRCSYITYILHDYSTDDF